MSNDTLGRKNKAKSDDIETLYSAEPELNEDDEESGERHNVKNIHTPMDAERQLAADIVLGAISDYRKALRLNGRTPQERVERKNALEYSKLFFNSSYYSALLGGLEGKYLLDLFQAEYEEENKVLKGITLDLESNKAYCPFCLNEMRLQRNKKGKWVGVCYACKYSFVREDFLLHRSDSENARIGLFEWQGTVDAPCLDNPNPKVKPKILGRLRTRLTVTDACNVSEVATSQDIYKGTGFNKRIIGKRYTIRGQEGAVVEDNRPNKMAKPEEIAAALEDANKVSEGNIDSDEPADDNADKNAWLFTRTPYGEAESKRATTLKCYYKAQAERLARMAPEQRRYAELSIKRHNGTMTDEEYLEWRHRELRSKGVPEEEITAGDEKALYKRSQRLKAAMLKKEVV